MNVTEESKGSVVIEDEENNENEQYEELTDGDGNRLRESQIYIKVDQDMHLIILTNLLIWINQILMDVFLVQFFLLYAYLNLMRGDN